MEWLNELWRRVRYLLRASNNDADLAEEMRLHMELRAAERSIEGASDADASAAARRRFGNATLLRETSRDAWGWAWLESLAQDVRYALRTLRASPGFTLTAVLSLALGIGANTAIFSLLNALMLRSLPVEDPQRLVQLDSGSNGNYFTNPIWEQVRDHQQALAGTLAYSQDRFDLADGGESQFAEGIWASGDFFRVLGVPALRGRVFTMDDDRRGAGKSAPVAVISYAFWQSHFSGDPAIIGKTIKLDFHTFEIVGVTPPWFRGLDVDRGFQVAIPIGCEPVLHVDQNLLDHRSAWWLKILGRLGPETSIEQADARLKQLAPSVNRATIPAEWEARGEKDRYLRRTFSLRPAATGFSATGTQYRKALQTLMAIVGLVLLIACANIANLLLARGTARQREISIRLAIGAGRRRVIRQLLTESVLLSLLGTAGGLIFARWGTSALVSMLSTDRNRLELDVSADAHVLAFASFAAIATAVLFGLAPAFRATRVPPSQAMKENARVFAGAPSRFGLGRALVAGQVALSLVLLAGAGLFAGTLRNLLTTHAGFNTQNILLVRVDTLAKVPKAHRLELYQDLLERLGRVRGVTSSASSDLTPISNTEWNEFTYPEGYTAKFQEDSLTCFNRVSPGYFATMATPLVSGRDFSRQDRLGSPKVMIINEHAARTYFGTRSPLGKMIGLDVFEKKDVKEFYEVIGVVKDTKYRTLSEEPLNIAYLATAQDSNPSPEITFVLRASGPINTLLPDARNAIADVSRGISLEFRSFETQVGESLGQQKLVAMLSVFFAVLALVLAMIGLYGVTAYSVARRRSEIGIRIALGARREAVLWLVLRDVGVMLTAGTLVGLAATVAAGRLVASLLYGVKPADPLTLAAAAILLGAATAFAGFIPALKASRLDPTAALRND